MTMRALSNLIYAAQGGNATNDTPTLIREMRADLIKTGCDPNSEYLRAAHDRARMLDAGLKAARDVRYQGVRGFGAALRDLVTRVTDQIAAPFQQRSVDWLNEICRDDPTDLAERRARFIEEALELVQSLDMTEEDVRLVLSYVYSRPPGLPAQEFGGVATTLAVLADYTGYDLMDCGEDELERVSDPEVMDKIRRKRATRHGRGPLPGMTAPTEVDDIAVVAMGGPFPGNGQASKKVEAGTVTAEEIRETAAKAGTTRITGDTIRLTADLEDERSRLIAEIPLDSSDPDREDRIRIISQELKRREKPADYSGMRLGSDTFLD
jgi:hypothetical protein